MDSIYDRIILRAYKWTQNELYEAFRSLAFCTEYEQLEELFGDELKQDKTKETEKVIQQAKDRVATKLQIELCLEHLVCPECAGDLSKALCQTKDEAYWNIYQCKNCSFTTKRNSNYFDEDRLFKSRS